MATYGNQTVTSYPRPTGFTLTSVFSLTLRLTLRAPGDTLHHDIVGNRRVVAGHPVEHVIKREFGIIGRADPRSR